MQWTSSESIARSLRNRLAIAVVAVAVLVAASAFAVFAVLRMLGDEHRDVTFAAAERVARARSLATALSNRTRDGRGYLLSGDPEFLASRAVARAEFVANLEVLAERPHPEQFERLRELLATYDAVSDRLMDLRASAPADVVERWNAESHAPYRALQAELARVIAEEDARFAAARDDDAERTRTVETRTLIAGALVVVVVIVLLAILVRTNRELLARARARHQREMFELLEQVPVGIYVMTADARPFYANRSARQLIGERIDRELAPFADGSSIYEVGTDTRYDVDRLPITHALRGESLEASDLELRRADDRIPLHVRGAPVEIDGRLAFAVVAFQDIRELRRIANTDSLTGLPNRTELAERFGRRRVLAERAGYPLALAIIDLDRFKSINDTYGHAAGDEVLRRTAGVLSANLRRSDDIGRWGGEEIVILLSMTSLDGATAALEKALAALRAERFTSGDRTFGVTFSAGVVVVEPGEGLVEAIARADIHLYAAKAAGRARIHG